MSGIFIYFADPNDSYFVLQVNLAAAMEEEEEEEEDVSYMVFSDWSTRFILQSQAYMKTLLAAWIATITAVPHKHF